jgi:hypothetical protein
MGPLLLALLGIYGSSECGPERREGSYLWRPAYCLDDVLRGPAVPYVPQPGDLFLATDRALWSRAGHWLAGGAGVHHSAILFQRRDGRVGLLEAGPFYSVRVEVLDPLDHVREHVGKGDRVWIRRRCLPLTPEQTARLTAFAEAQEGKSFAILRLLRQLTPFRSRGPVRTAFLGRSHGERQRYFCSELVLEACLAAGLLDPDTTRPAATYPRDLFFGRSKNPYLDKHLNLEEAGWCPPARWTGCP